ncbi:hypothetical protein [Microbacterium sp. NIBRBAC000506063]|uniref:hypothetical protein n=1 Tax=Microbacterium sp. NIBRBAC000506063 TaxID=2734618 RepID=UPI001BB567A5|nr:hypothetical protein [Microbacterium sp. NIBRBAC000506063]QTV79247.1 hypothetical protein KAE78_09360 [Microbacterium sp. NIBRBAC000506063]
MLATALDAERLHQIRRGWYMAQDEWDELWAEDRHRAHVIAVARDAQSRAPMSYTSAGVLHELPLFRMHPERVHTTTAAPLRNSSGPDVMRHVEALPPDDVTVVDGILCATLSRTVFDLIRTLPIEAAISAADAAERKVTLRGREWDHDARAVWRLGLQRRIDAGQGARGIRQARFVAEFADGRAQLPGESVSRLQLWQLGFAAPSLQVVIPGPHGNTFEVDFGLDDVGAFGEFDGETKYRDEAMRRGRSIEDVVLAEKQREDWIRGRTQRRFARWSTPHIRTHHHLGRRLAAFGIRAP